MSKNKKIGVDFIKKTFSGKKVLIIGDIMVDSYLWGKVERISPEAPVPVVQVVDRQERLGGAANVALNIAALGAEPILLSACGNDSHGKTFIQLLENKGIASDYIVLSDQRKTTVKFRIISGNTQMLRVDEEDTLEISEYLQKKLIDSILYIIINRGIDVLIFQDYDKGIISRNLISKTNAVCKKKGVPVAVDPKRKNFLYYQDVDLFKPNLSELKEGLKLDKTPVGLQELNRAAHKLMEINNQKATLITLADKGVYVGERNQRTGKIRGTIIPAHLRNIADVSGAGDTVISVAALGLASGLSPYQYAELANLAGGLVCEQVGVVPVTSEKLFEEAKNKELLS